MPYEIISAKETREFSRESIARAVIDAMETARRNGLFYIQSHRIPKWLAEQLREKGYTVTMGTNGCTEVSWGQPGDL